MSQPRRAARTDAHGTTSRTSVAVWSLIDGPVRDPRGAGPVAAGPGVRGLVSVVVPTYNRAKLIGATIESALAQTYTNLEIIVADDGSTDDTRRVVAAYGPRVRYVYQDNAGVCAARNLALSHAQGEYIALLDSDDLWEPWKVEAQVAMLERFPELGMVWTDMTAVSDALDVLHARYLRRFYTAYERVSLETTLQASGSIGTLLADAPAAIAGAPCYRGELFSAMILGNLVHTSTAMLRRSRVQAAGGFDETLGASGEDYEFHLRTCACGPVGFIDSPSIRYRVGNPDQLTAPRYKVQIALGAVAAVRRWMTLAGPAITLPQPVVTRRLAELYGWLGEEAVLVGDTAHARAPLLRSLRINPRRPRLLALLALSLLPPTMSLVARAAWRKRRRRGRT